MELLRKLSCQDEKMQTLRNNFEALDSRAADVKTEVEDAELRTGKKRKHEVENWLRNVERMKNEVQTLEQERKISLPLFGNPVDKLKAEIAQLRERGSFQGGFLLDVCATRGESLLSIELTGQTVQKNLEKIWACLMDDSKELRIGIYGMGGVGKTSRAVNIHNKLIENPETCDRVFWCTVSKDHDYSIGKLQGDIAKRLKLDLSNENDEMIRAATLLEAFARRGKCVLFLDDVWDKIDLERVGIPSACKLILTTRSLDVCHKMGCKEFKVESLSKEEAWNLFWVKLCNGEDTTLCPEVIDIAKSVAAECDGLPLAIITMAGSMRGVDDIREWRNVFEQLKELTMGHEDMENDVLPSLKLSYIRLNGTKLKDCFLYCALYPEDWCIPRNELIRYFIAEGLIDRSKSLRSQFDEGHTILHKLERSCLLERDNNYNGDACVKMHDLNRDMALKITENRFMVKAGVGLKEIPHLQECAGNLEKVSLMDNKIKEIRCGWSSRCSSLSTLNLKHNRLKSIAASFFEHMHALQVLDLSNNSEIEVLPNSISDLVKLTALLLGGCTSLTYVPPLGKLRALEELDLSSTRINEVPQGVDMLVNLKSLNMKGTKMLEKIPSGTLSRLSHLQLLRLGGTSAEIQAAEELERLTKLEELGVGLDDVHLFNRIVKFLPHNLEALTIWNQWFTSDCFCDVFLSFWGNARRLQFCEIKNCRGIESLLSVCSTSTFSSSSRNAPFQSVQILKLVDLQDLRGLIRWKNLAGSRLGFGVIATHGTFSNLKNLAISNCHKMKSVLTPGLQLPHLEQITIVDCNEIEEIFDGARTTLSELNRLWLSCSLSELESILFGNNYDMPLILPKLKILKLGSLSKLESICEGIMVCDSIEEIYIGQCPKLKRLPLSLPIDNNGQPSAPVTLKKILPKLKKLELGNLSKLESICEGIMVCDSIEEIYIGQCPKLKRLPLSLPIDNNGQPSAPVTLKKIQITRRDIDWWKSLEWNPPNTKDVLQSFLHFCPRDEAMQNLLQRVDWWKPDPIRPGVQGPKSGVQGPKSRVRFSPWLIAWT